MQTDLELLIKLQEHDAAVDELKAQAEALNPAIKTQNAKLDQLKNALKSSKDATTAHLKKKKELEMEVDTKEGEIRKHQGSLNSLKTNDAYKAMLGEIDAAKKMQAKIEDDILVLMESIDSEEKKYKEAEKQFKTDEVKIKSEIGALESQKAGIEADAKKKQEERDTFAATVPENLKSHYEILREKLGGIAIVPVINGGCGGCRMNLVPAKANNVKKAKDMVVCDNCSRILYLPQPQEAPAVTQTPAA